MSKIPFLKNSILLAPMAGITDSGFRKVCRKYGADGTFSEMISTKGMYYNDRKSLELLYHCEDEKPLSIQIFGSDIECFKYAAEYITKIYSSASIDINMGCPAPKIFQNGDGCALMRRPDLAYDLITSVKNNTDLPVSVKFRSGVDDKNINAVEFAKICSQAGADFITVHGRTREQFYSGKANIEIIKQVCNAVDIPVIANGDIIDTNTAKTMLEYTGAYCIMIGRASLGNPLIFNTIKRELGHQTISIPENLDIFDIAVEHLTNVINHKGERIAVKEFRKHMLWYLKGIKNAAKYKQLSCDVSTLDDCKRIFEIVKKEI